MVNEVLLEKEAISEKSFIDNKITSYNSSEKKERSIFFDNYKGILIFLVVLGHYLYTYALKFSSSLANDLFVFIYTFHMPAFIFISGFFSKSENSRSKHSILKLCLYYFVFNTLMMLFLYAFRGTKISLLSPYNSYWYILSLICWRLSIKQLANVKFIFPISIILALLCGYWSEFGNILSIRRTIAFFPFFLWGYKIDKDALEKFKAKKSIIKYIGYCILTMMIVVGVYWFINNYTLSFSMLIMSSYKKPIHILYRIAIFVISILAIIMLYLTTPNVKIPILTKIGRNSLLIYLVHRFPTLIFAWNLPVANYSYLYIIYAIIATFITVIILGSNKLNNMTNKFFNSFINKLTSSDKKHNYLKTLLLLGVIIILLTKPLKLIF